MPKTKKKFIDRKSAVSFNLVHRSQQDPLIADEKAPQHVLVEASEKKSKTEDKKCKEEQKKYGIFFDDDYNYLQHLRGANQINVDWEPVETIRIHKTDFPPLKLPQPEQVKLTLPSSVFASQVEEDVGLLNKAAPRSGLQLDLDPDVVAAMDEDFDFDDPDNELEDNFIEMANADGESDDEVEDKSYDSDADVSSGAESDEDGDEVRSLNGPQFTFTGEETKSRFTDYSMSSSVMRRNEQLSLLDSKFERMYAGYDDSEIGALDCEEIEGYVAPDSAIVLQCAEEFATEKATPLHETDRTLQRLQPLSESEESDNFIDLKVKDNEDKWDCESILSTYSNLYNHPKLISEPLVPRRIRISGRTGIPLDVLDGGSNNKLTVRALSKFDNICNRDQDGAESVKSMMSTLTLLSLRPKEETPEQKRHRKTALKDYRRDRRMEKKANSLAFKEETIRQEKIILNNKTNVQGVHIL